MIANEKKFFIFIFIFFNKILFVWITKYCGKTSRFVKLYQKFFFKLTRDKFHYVKDVFGVSITILLFFLISVQSFQKTRHKYRSKSIFMSAIFSGDCKFCNFSKLYQTWEVMSAFDLKSKLYSWLFYQS